VGFVRVKAKVWNVEKHESAREVLLLAGTGAVYTVLPRSLLEEMGVKSIGKRSSSSQTTKSSSGTPESWESRCKA